MVAPVGQASRGRSTLYAPLSGDWTDELACPGPADARFEETSDGGHVLWVAQVGEDLTKVAWDGIEGEPFQLIPQGDGNAFAWSPDRRHVAWYGARDERLFVAVDGVEHHGEGFSRSVPPTFSPDGQHLAYGVFVGGATRLVVDGEIYGEWHPAAIRPVYSPDSRRLAFVAENRELKPGEKPRDYRQWMVVDGVAHEDAQGIAADDDAIVFSPDSRRLAYIRLEDGAARLVLDGATGDRVGGIAYPTFSPDSARFVHAVGDRRADTMSMVGDAIRSARTYWRVGPPIFSADSARLAYFAARKKDLGLIVVDDVEGPDFHDFWGNPVFSADGRRLAYLGMRHEGGFLRRSTAVTLVLDGTSGPAWEEVSSPPKFSPDGLHVAFSARRGKDWYTVVDGVAGPAFEAVGPPRYSSSGRLAYLAQERADDGAPRYRVVVGTTSTPAMLQGSEVAAGESFIFSPDGEHVVTVGVVGGAWRPIVDAKIGPGGAGAGSPRFVGDHVAFLMASSDGAHRVTTRLAG